MQDFPPFSPPPGTTVEDWGELAVEQKRYAPLEPVRLTLGPADTRAERWRVEWYDGLGNRYGVEEGRFAGRHHTVVEFLAGGAPGMQYARLWLDGDERPARLVNWYLAAETRLHTGDLNLDALYPLSRDAMLLNRRRYPLPEGQVVGYTTADSVQTLAYWLRDMFYNLPGYMLWEHDVASGFEALFARQNEDGSLPDGVRADGSTWRMITESDVEYLAVLALWRTWLVTGDDAWLARNLEPAERALRHLRSSPLRWAEPQGFVRRAHTCDTWDFSIYDGDVYSADTPAVASLCDQTGYVQALRALHQIHLHRGDRGTAQGFREELERFRRRAGEVLWDGEKFQHHLHLDPFDHGGFDESAQLAMSNTWAITRGFADTEQARRIVATYRRRLAETGDRFPWWSLQPGYPHEDYPFLARHPYQHQGGYCNGGLMPWVGGALTHGCFVCGEEAWGGELLRDYAAFLRERGGEIFTWYWPNGAPGFRTANTTGHDGWAMGHWLAALFEGAAGIEIVGPAMDRTVVSPRWAALGLGAVSCTVHLPASEAYTAYRWRQSPGRTDIAVTGSGSGVDLRVLLPEGARPGAVRLDGEEVEWQPLTVSDSVYVALGVELGGGASGVRQVSVGWSR